MKNVILTLSALFVLGCENDKAPSGNVSNYGLAAFTDKTDYMRNEKTVITIQNSTDRSVVFQGCSSDVFYYRDKWVDDQWVKWSSLVCSDTVMNAMIIDPNANLSDSIVGHKPGTYRFRYPHYWIGGENESGTVVSNAFTIH